VNIHIYVTKHAKYVVVYQHFVVVYQQFVVVYASNENITVYDHLLQKK